MTHASGTAARLPRTWLPALMLSLLFSVLCAAALYSLLARHDRSLAAQRNAATVAAAGQGARAMARTFAWFSESLVTENLAAVQQALAGHTRQAGLLDAAVITEDNVIVAAHNPAVIGRRLEDAAWMVARGAVGGSIAAGVEQGRPVLIVIEPIRRQDHIVGWVRLIAATPQHAAGLRSTEELARDVALAIVPLFILMTTLLTLTLHRIMNRVRSLIRRILADAMDRTADPMGKTAETLDVG